MKKIIAAALIAASILTTVGCAKKEEVIGGLNSEYQSKDGNKHQEEAHGLPSDKSPTTLTFENLSSLLLAIDNGTVSIAALTESTAKYVTAHNDKVKIVEFPLIGTPDLCAYSMMTLDDNAELNEMLNAAIVELSADGTIGALVEKYIVGGIEGEPAAAELPHFDGAETVKVALTGDLPPMDLVTSDGLPAGFNVALLSAIAELTKINFEPVIMDAGARLTALSSGRVDALFWTDRSYCTEHDVYTSVEVPDTLITEHYFIDNVVFVAKK